MNWELIDRLLSGSAYGQSKRDEIESRLIDLEPNEHDDFTGYQIESIIEDLKNNQLDPITHGTYYSKKTDIINHLKKLR